MMARDEAHTVSLVNEHRVEVRAAVEQHGGHEHETIGDAFVLIFQSATAAVSCALDIQCRFSARNAAREPADRIWLRIGIHLDDVIVTGPPGKEAGHDIFGDGVNIAARVEALARPGGICVTESVWVAVRGRLTITAVPLGRVGLKNIANGPLIWQIDVPGALPLPRSPRRVWLPATVSAAGLGLAALAWASVPAAKSQDYLGTFAVLDVQDSAQSSFIEGAARLRAGNAAEALPYFERALSLEPDQPYLRLVTSYASGEAWTSDADVVRGLELAQAAARSRPESVGADFVLLVGRIPDERASPDRLLDDLDRWFDAHPDDAIARVIAAEWLAGFGAGTPEDWLEVARSATRADPGAALGWSVVGWGSVQWVDEPDSAFAAANAALARAPKNGEALALLGHLDRRAGDLPAARDHLIAAVRAAPSTADLRFELARICLEINDESCRLAQLSWARAEETDPRSRVTFASIHAAHLAEFGRVQEAQDLYAQTCPAAFEIPDVVAGFWCLDSQLRAARYGWADQVLEAREAHARVLARPDVPDSERRRFAMQVQLHRVESLLQSGELSSANLLLNDLESVPAAQFAYSRQPDRIRELRVRWLFASDRISDGNELIQLVQSPCLRGVLRARESIVRGQVEEAVETARFTMTDPRCLERQPRAEVAEILVQAAEIYEGRGEPAGTEAALIAFRNIWPNPDPTLELAQRAAKLSEGE